MSNAGYAGMDKEILTICHWPSEENSGKETKMGAKRILSAVLAGMGVIFGIVPDCDGAVYKEQLTLQAEIPTIKKAAERNGIKFGSDNWFILLAIRKSENGRSGCEFGIKHPRAWDTNLDTQAGWAAATIMKNRKRWKQAGMPRDFVTFLADRYCPKECDPVGHFNWKRNVKFWINKFEK